MTHTLLFSFDRKGDAKLCGATTNSWRSAPLIWEFMEERYLPPFIPFHLRGLPPEEKQEKLERYGYKPTRTSTLSGNAINEICELAVDPLVPFEHRLVLCTTLDGPLIRSSDIPVVAAAFRAFPKEAGDTSLSEQADLLEAYIGNDNIIAFGWAQNDICGRTWQAYHDDGSGEAKPYNCLWDNEHYWLVEDITDREQLAEYAEQKLAELKAESATLAPGGVLASKWWQFEAGTPVEKIGELVEQAMAAGGRA